MLTPLAATTAYNFSQALLILLQGMAGIFVFMGVFYALILGLEKLFKDKTST